MKKVKINFDQKIVNQYGQQLKDNVMKKVVPATFATVLTGHLLSLTGIDPKDITELWRLCKDIAGGGNQEINESQIEFLIKHAEKIDAFPLIKGQILDLLKTAEKDLK